MRNLSTVLLLLILGVAVGACSGKKQDAPAAPTPGTVEGLGALPG